MVKKLYKTSEFAALCGVTKHTLYHYDAIGLLKPSITKENGYRYYTSDQFGRFLIISVLKMAGTSLEEMKEYLDHYDSQRFIEVLDEKRRRLKEEAVRIRKMYELLSGTIESVRDHLHVKAGEIQILECKREYLIATRVAAEGEEDMESMFFNNMSNHFQYCSQRDLETRFHVGEIVLKEDMERGMFRESYYYSNSSGNKRIQDERLFIKPEGTYAVMYHQGDYDKLYAAYQEMKERVEQMGYVIGGNLYEEDVIDYLAESNPENYILKLSLQVERAANAGTNAATNA